MVGLQADAAAALTAHVQSRFEDATFAVLLYGSALRDGLDIEDGLFDILVVVDGYRRAYGGWTQPLLNTLLPPNVFYLECPLGDRTVRAKYALVSRAQLASHTRRRCLQSYFWGRLAQPVVVTWTRNDAAAQEVDKVLNAAVTTFAAATAPLLPATFDAREVWERGLAASYRTEFRPEPATRARTLTERDLHHYQSAGLVAARALDWEILGAPGAERFSTGTSRLGRWRGRVAWFLRRAQGRTLHVLRLVKATWTFTGGIDYLLWKIERHSGVKVEVSDRVRRHPLIFGWWTLWRLRRKGGFR